MELMIVLAVGTVLTVMSIVHLQPTLQGFRANAAQSAVEGALRRAREIAISDRRTVAVQFGADAFGNSQVSLSQYQLIGVPPAVVQVLNPNPILVIPIQNSVTFRLFPQMPDTPDRFGNAAPVEFGGVAYGPGSILNFQSDGTFTDGLGNTVNGSVFMGIQNFPSSARAVTVLGATGRVKAYNGTGNSWFVHGM